MTEGQQLAPQTTSLESPSHPTDNIIAQLPIPRPIFPLSTKHKRRLVSVACTPCRKSKAKCNAAVPRCSRCVTKELDCKYDTDPQSTRTASLKRKVEFLESENGELHELYQFIRTRSDPEALDVLHRMRTVANPLELLRFIKEGDLLLQTHLSHSASTGGTSDSLLSKLDLDAWNASSIKVKASPWTTIASDGLVSELISIFFERDQYFTMPFVDKEAFLRDVSATDVPNPRNMKYCSPLLVNAICADASFSCDNAKRVDFINKGKIGSRFFNGCRKLLDKEMGRASIPTVQALFIMFHYCGLAGEDRTGTLFRFAGCDMLRRLTQGSIKSFPQGHSPFTDDDRCRVVLSRTAWGIFCYESVCAYAYLQASLVPIPPMPRYFADTSVCKTKATESQFKHQTSMPIEIFAFDAMCTLYELFYNIMRSLYNVETGGDVDVQTRLTLYEKLNVWELNLPSKEKYEGKNGRLYHYLRGHYHLAALSIFRPLQTSAVTLPPLLGTPSNLCLSHCEGMINEVEDCLTHFPSEHKGSTIQLYFAYTCSFTLIFYLNTSPESHTPFVKACRIFHRTAPDYPLSLRLLQGLRSLALALNVDLPEDAMHYFTDVKLERETSLDIPMNYVLPQHQDMLEFLSDDGTDSTVAGVQLADIMSKWGSMTFEP